MAYSSPLSTYSNNILPVSRANLPRCRVSQPHAVKSTSSALYQLRLQGPPPNRRSKSPTSSLTLNSRTFKRRTISSPTLAAALKEQELAEQYVPSLLMIYLSLLTRCCRAGEERCRALGSASQSVNWCRSPVRRWSAHPGLLTTRTRRKIPTRRPISPRDFWSLAKLTAEDHQIRSRRSDREAAQLNHVILWCRALIRIITHRARRWKNSHI